MNAACIRRLSAAAMAVSILLYGCATEPVTRPTPVKEKAAPAPSRGAESQSTAREEQPVPQAQPRTMSMAASTAAPSDPAVVALLATARKQAAAGELAAAAASLERALRIEPKNPWTWYQLGIVRFRQGRLAQAEQFARKSDALAGANSDIRARSWRLIALVRESQGDHAGARMARETAKGLAP